MDESFLEVIIPKLKSIIGDLEKPGYDEYRDYVESLWNNVSVLPYYPRIVYAVDGGSYIVEFKGFTLAIVTGLAHGYIFDGEKYRSHKSYKTAYVGRIIPPQNTSERVKMYREIIEGKIAYYACENGSLVLVDGSILPIIIRPRPEPQTIHSRYLLEDMVKLINDRDGDYFNKLIECIDASMEDYKRLIENPICSVVMTPRNIESEELDLITISIEYIEKLYVYGRLLDKVLNSRCKIIFIAKTSSSTEIFGSLSYPDIILFEKLTRKKGYSTSMLRRLIEYKDLPQIDMPKKFMNTLLNYVMTGILYSYMRLADDGPVLKIEVIDRYDRLRLARETILMDAFRSLNSIASEGYPYPLKIVHKDVHITHSDVKKLLHILGLDIEVTGREVLEI